MNVAVMKPARNANVSRSRAREVARHARKARVPREAAVAITLQVQLNAIRAFQNRIAALEAKLRLQKQCQEQVWDEHPVAFIQLLANGVVRHANSSAIALLGANKQRVALTPFREFIPSSDIEPFYRHIHQCLTCAPEDRKNEPAGGTIETDVRIKAGEIWKAVRLISRASPRALDGRERLIPTALVDMTHQLAARHWAVRENQGFQHLLESIDGIVWEAEHPFRLRFVSLQFERLLGYSPEQWMRNPAFWDDRIHVEDRERVVRERDLAVRAGAPHVTEYRMHSARGGILWLRESILTARTSLGHTRLHGLVVNITALKHAEAELRRANQQLGLQAEESRRHLEQTVQSMETFCYGIAHELRAPVRATRGFSDLLLKETLTGKEKLASDYANRISHASAYMDKLIEDLLAYGRLHHTELVLVGVSIKTTIERVLRHLATNKRRQADIIVHPCSDRVQAHPTLFMQALENLVSNALKFVAPDTAPRVVIDTRRIGDDRVRISVRDNGIGIDPAWQEKIFGVFQRGHSQSEYPGTGIGLAVVKRIVELMDGKVGLVSSPGQGSTFWIELPLAPKEPADSPSR
jgi:PAS domain S-box-containing protein